MCSRWAIRGGCSEEVSFEQQPHERRRWPGRVRGTPPDGMSQGLRDMKGWPRSPGSTPLASSGRSPCAGSGVHAGLCLRGPGQCGLPWRGRWGRRGRGSPGGLALIGTLEPVVDTSRGLLPSLRLPGGEWAGQGQGPLPGPSALVGFPVHRGPTVCTTDGRAPASCVSSTAESVKAF